MIVRAISIEQEEMLAGDGPSTEAPAPKKKGGLTAMVQKENKRFERSAIDIPKLGPLGDESFWDFKIFPRA